MGITIYRHHSADCPLSGQSNWPQSTINLEGKKPKHKQNKWSLNARRWSEAQQNATKLKNDLEAVLAGKPVRQKSITLEAALAAILVLAAEEPGTPSRRSRRAMTASDTQTTLSLRLPVSLSPSSIVWLRQISPIPLPLVWW